MNTRRLGRLVGATVAAAGTIAAMSACGMLGGSVPTAEVGDCTNADDLNTQFTEFPTVDCSEEHDAEVFYKFEMPDGDFPGDDAISTEAEAQCTGDAFTDYVGVAYADSEIYANFVPPNEDTWNDNNDREVICILVLDGETTTGSLEGANR
ncbi:hypothetical protein Bcav_3422 [Beutenbergia cavernae DSM 12333]|uniref:Septum formation-related domain-containing protein n=1 Tax=Beutenbergia cavernae (strain ATCC BAA-8 / DSM 12333 / CCUG 43141 / JCM 11478 / NBRC 16432 / NCIMB 13614 / HKI 0122) TaxID=471853 RepID=C5C239_BEUC1|nr:septum formation family protein [Beutenbergia cavernae]ACQ81664.1 hypothetical protein Bcav_3422 [Beutenbergia cavernae DSM 12333]